MKIGWDALSRFAFSMATCLGSGMPQRKALELSAGAGHLRSLDRVTGTALARCDRGLTISEALEPQRRLFPGFFLPVIRAGELGGRHVEAYELVQAHCDRLKPAMTLVRNAWLYPLVCIVSGWVIQAGIMVYFGHLPMALRLLQATFVNGAVVVFGAWLLLRIPAVKLAVHWLFLQIPFVRKALIDLSVVVFFATFRLAYEAGGLSVLCMFDLALATVSNLAIRQDFMRARPVLEEQGSFADAFAEPELLDETVKSSIAAGAMSGDLGTSLGQIVRMQATQLEASLDLFNRIFQRLVAYSVVFSIVETVLMCVLYTPTK
jgi:type II secretory pathway component PulF